MKECNVTANDVSLHVTECGAGPAVLFCHGFPDTWRSWRRQMEAVSGAGYRAIALDTRGYGESTGPDEASAYTAFNIVGDLVAVLDALACETATLVGHDFGAVAAWTAALIRPDRFRAVFGVSVPPFEFGGGNFLTDLREKGLHDFYMFRQMRPEADSEWAEARKTLPAAFYWTSGETPEETRWHPMDTNRGLLRPAPSELPGFVNPADFAVMVSQFERNGFHRPLNYYRALGWYLDMTSAFSGCRIQIPSFFLVGAADGLNALHPVTQEVLGNVLADLRGLIELPEVGHWPQLEAAGDTSAALLGFLDSIH
ncbi:alpha/beta fold hydrolase [Paraburkholderia lycopersici]|uniref:Pimeloyl-ACP methyl ester carboxylesterase n=1 Tax=Paraburkholderia lycopersici TaxID=416944 RepID=A0A1G6WRJ3_9BURK|nr:alpha/beta hydrolase [Paraburkholderia lycopersici]SDD68394.1 Pimeloyl-ACP methyl ester carboxylesterase [Paraburkholderia lycopersici]